MSTATTSRPPSAWPTTRSATRLLSAGILLLLLGCSTYEVDWNGRIGTYTYDQAVVDMGPPDKSAKLSDGITVAEWMTRRGYSRGSAGFAYGYGYHAYPYYFYPAPFYQYQYDPPTPDYFIRLTFGPDGKLQSWKRVVR